jgi:hypothetical protein
MDAWYDGSAVCVIAVAGQGDPLDLAEHEVRTLISKLEHSLAKAKGATVSDPKSDLRNSWAIPLRHLAACRFYLPESLANPSALEAERNCNHYLHNNELGLALHQAEFLGLEQNASADYWREFYFAASNMGLVEDAARFKTRSDA